MSNTKQIDPFYLLSLVISIVGLLLITLTDFAGFYLTGYYSGSRYSCLTCEYSTPVDLMAQILVIVFLIGQIVISLNELLPNRIIDKQLNRHGLILAVLTLVFTLLRAISFAATYYRYELWFEAGFYGGLISGIINTILFLLKELRA